MSRVYVAALTLSASVLVGLAVSEGYRDDAYIPVPGDVPTIGFGETSGVKMGDRTTPVRALIRLQESAEQHAQGVRRCAPVPMLQREFDAFVSLAYNVGVTRFCNSSIPGKLNAGDYEAACRTILDFDKFRDRTKPKVLNKSTGEWEHPLVRLPGLTKRRQAEYRTCMGQ
jgi:lysozyme